MDPKRDSGGMLLAPGATTSSPTYSFPSRELHPTPRPTPTPFPRVDDHIVVPEGTGEEVIRNRKVIALPANEEHGDAQAHLGAVLSFQLRPGYVLSVELLTRVLVGSNFATDVCIRKAGIDPTTGVRFLEELAFEVVNEQRTRDVTEKAEDMTRRGVRRIFTIFVKTGEISEWSKSLGEFVALPKQNGEVVDPVFVRPVAVKALIDHTVGEIEAARALIAKKNPEIMKLQQQRFDEGLDEGHKKGLDEGHKKGLDEGHKKGLDEGHKKGLDEGLAMSRNMLVRWAQSRFGELPASILNRIHSADEQALTAWTDKMIAQAPSLSAVFGADLSPIP
jgi:hypothetical protein